MSLPWFAAKMWENVMDSGPNGEGRMKPAPQEARAPPTNEDGVMLPAHHGTIQHSAIRAQATTAYTVIHRVECM